jgi:hypothetical protein
MSNGCWQTATLIIQSMETAWSYGKGLVPLVIHFKKLSNYILVQHLQSQTSTESHEVQFSQML